MVWRCKKCKSISVQQMKMQKHEVALSPFDDAFKHKQEEVGESFLICRDCRQVGRPEDFEAIEI